MRSTKPPKAPAGTSAAARKLWHEVVTNYELDEHEMALLTAAVATIGLIDLLQADVDTRGPIVESPQGLKANPAVVEVRQQRITLARLLGALRMPSGDEADLKRPQRRTAVRSPGVSGIVR